MYMNIYGLSQKDGSVTKRWEESRRRPLYASTHNPYTWFHPKLPDVYSNITNEDHSVQ